MKYKKIIAVLSALTLLAGCSENEKPESSSEITGEPVTEDTTEETVSCFSCSDTKKPESSSEITSEPVTEDATEEKVFKTYSYEDFKEIEVPWNETDNEPPVELKRYEFPELDFGEKIPVCMKSDDPFKYYANYKQYTLNTGGNVNEQTYDNFIANIDAPQKGASETIQIDGNKLYVIVNYDKTCYEHEWSLFCIDMDTDNVSEVYSYSGLEEEGRCWYLDASVTDSVLYISNSQRDENRKFIHSYITAIDLDTKEESVIFENKGSLSLSKLPDGNLLLSEFVNGKPNILEYDTKAKKITEKDMSEFSFVSNAASFTYLEKHENSNKLDLVTENYRLSTGTTSASIIRADEKKVIFTTNGDITVMHTFDFEKMEHYVTELPPPLGKGILHGDGVVLTNFGSSISDMYYFIPDLGLAFTIAKDFCFGAWFFQDGKTSFVEGAYENGVEHTVKPEYCAFCWLEEKEQ